MANPQTSVAAISCIECNVNAVDSTALLLDFVRSILPFTEREDFKSPEYIQAVCGELQKTMPERFDGELELIVTRLLEPNLEQIVKFSAERTINNQFSLEEMQRLLILVESARYNHCVVSCLEVGGRTMKCLATAILKAAMLNGNEDLIREAIDHEANPNCSFQGQTPLGLATKEPEKSHITLMLLNAGAEPGRWHIHAAAERGHIGLVELLVPRAPWPGLGELVRIAARSGSLELLRSLIKLGATYRQWLGGEEEEHPLHLALLGHHFEFAQLLVDLEPLNDSRIACLMLAIKRGDRLAAEFLIEHGADVNTILSPSRPETALALSIRSGQKDMIQLLLRHGAYPNTFLPHRTTGTDKRSIQTAFEEAIRSGSIEKTQLLLSMGAKVKESGNTSFPLGLTVMESPHLIPILLRAGADIGSIFEWDSPGLEGNSATMLETAVQSAIASRSLDVVEIVLRLGAPVNRAIPHDYMPSAIELAVTQSVDCCAPLNEELTVALVKLLLHSGANIRIPEFRGFFPDEYGCYEEHCGTNAVRMTLVQSAAAQGRTALVKLLVGAGAAADEPAGENGFTAIQAAARFGGAEMVEFLIKSRADVNAPSRSKYALPALLAAVAKDDLRSVELLLQAKADPNTSGMVIDEEGVREMTPLQTASCQPESVIYDNPKLRLEMLKLLLNAGANPLIPRFTDAKSDRSSLGWAVLHCDIAAVKLLLEHGVHADIPEALKIARDFESPIEIWYLLGATCCEDAQRSRDMFTCRCNDFESQPSKGQDPCLVSVSQEGYRNSGYQPPTIVQNWLPCCLHSATLQGNLSKVNHLLEHGADVNAVCRNTDLQALQIAAKNGYVAIAHRLIRAGAVPAIALEEAKFYGGLDISVLLEITQV